MKSHRLCPDNDLTFLSSNNKKTKTSNFQNDISFIYLERVHTNSYHSDSPEFKDYHENINFILCFTDFTISGGQRSHAFISLHPHVGFIALSVLNWNTWALYFALFVAIRKLLRKQHRLDTLISLLPLIISFYTIANNNSYVLNLDLYMQGTQMMPKLSSIIGHSHPIKSMLGDPQPIRV